jgi:large subunit ribosomal protein L15
MVHNKRRKNTRMRASHTHGWGAKKKHRGAGHRGGRGNAGQGKKGDARKTRIWKDTKHFGKYGFFSLSAETSKTINISHLQSLLPKLISEGKAIENKNAYIINLDQLGYQKLLGSGKPTKKLEITVQEASEQAKEKIEHAGGKLTLLKKPEEPKPEKNKPKEA